MGTTKTEVFGSNSKNELLACLNIVNDKRLSEQDRCIAKNELFKKVDDRKNPEFAMAAAESDEMLMVKTDSGWSIAHSVAFSSKRAGLRMIEKAIESGDSKVLMLADRSRCTVAHALASSSAPAARKLIAYPNAEVRGLLDSRGMTVAAVADITLSKEAETERRQAIMNSPRDRPSG